MSWSRRRSPSYGLAIWLARFRCTSARRSVRHGTSLAVLGLIAKAAVVCAQGLPGEPPLPLRYVDSARAGGATIRTYYSSGGHPISLLDSVDAPSGAAAASSEPLRVLFMGNSLTYYNGMARMFAALASAGTHRRVVVGVAAYPGGSLNLLSRMTDAQQVIRRFPWDYVVLQPRPMALDDSASIAQEVQLFQSEIAARKARLVMWEQYRTDPTLGPRAASNPGVAAVARAMEGTVAPIPAAWGAVSQADSSLWRRLFVSESDGHPSPLGSYLIALTAYQTITGQSPVGIPRAAGGVTFSEQEVEALQRAAASAR